MISQGPAHCVRRSFACGLMAGTALGVLMTGASPTRAQTAAPSSTTLPTISVEGQQGPSPSTSYKTDTLSSSKYTEPVLDTPASITVVPQKVIEETGATSLRDVLRTVPGITFGAGEGGGSQGDQIRIRGFTASTDLFIDGMRDIAQYTRDPFALQSVEVIKGPNSTYFGRGTTGGFVNQVTKTPTLANFYNGTLTAGTDDTRRAVADVNQKLDWQNGAVRLVAMVHDSDVAERDVTESFRWGVAPSIALGLGTQTRLTLSYFHLEQSNIPDYGFPVAVTGLGANGYPVNVKRSNFYGLAAYNTEETSDDQVTLKVEHDFNDQLTLRNQSRYARDTRYANVSPPRLDPTSLALGRVNANSTTSFTAGNLPTRDTENNFIINQTDLTARMGNEDVQYVIATGMEVSYEAFRQQSITYANVPGTSLVNPNPYRFYNGQPSLGARSEVEIFSAGAYTLHTAKFADDMVELIGGLRFDRNAADSHMTTLPNTPTIGVNRQDNFVSTKAAIVFKPQHNGSVYFATGTSFNPSAEAQSLSATVDNTTNPANAKPETNTSYEFGTKWNVLDETLALTAALFRVQKDNARTQDPNDPTDVTVLDGRQHVNGFEFGMAGNITKEWAIFGGYTYMLSKIDDSRDVREIGKRINNVPTHSMSIWTTYEALWDLQFGFGAQFVGHRFINTLNTSELEAYTVFDAMVAYHVTENIDLRLNVYNLTDELYFDRPHNGGNHAVPGAGRSALLSTSFRF